MFVFIVIFDLDYVGEGRLRMVFDLYIGLLVVIGGGVIGLLVVCCVV